MLGHMRRPWRMAGPAISIMRSKGSRWMLERLAEDRVPVFAIHGDRDMAVPISTARSAARRSRGELVVVHGGSHSWLLKDPESLPAIMHRLMRGRLGTAVLKAILDGGVDPNGATEETEHGGLAQQLANDPGTPGAERRPHRDLAGARGRTRQQQVGDVGAGNQQDKADGTQQDEQCGLHIADDHLL